jgi:hypothetical protein
MSNCGFVAGRSLIDLVASRLAHPALAPTSRVRRNVGEVLASARARRCHKQDVVTLSAGM